MLSGPTSCAPRFLAVAKMHAIKTVTMITVVIAVQNHGSIIVTVVKHRFDYVQQQDISHADTTVFQLRWLS